MSRQWWADAWREHGVALLLYMVLTIGLSWPLVRDFRTRILSDGGDARHLVWTLWHTQQWFAGNQPLFDAPLLYYPYGVTLLLHGMGPLMGVFSLPFWGWGPAAAYNGALLIGLWLTGYCMYLLARELGFQRGVALFAGIVLQVAPMHLAGTWGHLDKVFLGLLPLTLLALFRGLDPTRSPWWMTATALTLLLNALHSGYQFTFALLAVIFFWLVAWFTTGRTHWRTLLGRSALLAASTLVLVGPLLVATWQAADDPRFTVESNLQSLEFSPDLVMFFLPVHYSALFGSITRRFLPAGTFPHIENAVSLFWGGIVLCVLAWARGDRESRRWLLFTLLMALLALGPVLTVNGKTLFYEYKLPVVMPYAFLTLIPGLDFMRVPARFMMIAYVGLGISASFGLRWLRNRWPRWGRLIVGLAAALVLIEAWPRPWPQEDLPTVPVFYQRVADDQEEYGVFDLPLRIPGGLLDIRETRAAASVYQLFQMTHHKGIHCGYLSRTYVENPLFSQLLLNCAPAREDIAHNGDPAASCAGVQIELAHLGYRYVVWHKTLFPGSPGHATAQNFLRAVFGQQRPLLDDERVTVYEIPPLPENAPP